MLFLNALSETKIARRFRWVALQMEELKNLRLTRPRDVMKVLNTLPHDLNATYDQILSRIDSLYSQEVHAALQWLAFANRPLFIEEIAEACIIDPKVTAPVDPDRYMGPLDIADILCGLVVVEPPLRNINSFTPQTYVLSLSHFSVKEYLTPLCGHLQGPSIYRMESGLAHAFITISCIAYISYCHTQSQRKAPVSLPLQNYAFNQWAHHASLITARTGKEAALTVLEMLRNRKICLFWMEQSWLYWIFEGKLSSAPYLQTPYNRTRLHGFNDSELLKFYPLLHATVHNLFEVAQMLLQRHAAAKIFSPHGCILEAAVINQDLKMIELLLEHGANQTGALERALHQRNESVAIQLLYSGVDPRDNDVVVAAAYGSSTVMSAILQIGTTFSKTTLVRALNSGQNSLNRIAVQVLLDYAVTPTVRAFDISNRRSVYYQLLSTGVRLNLHLAVDFLLHNKLSFPDSQCSYPKLFLAAVQRQHHEVVQAVLDSHAKAHIHYSVFLWAVNYANSGRHHAVFCSLLPHMFRGDGQSSKGLQIAIALNKEKIFDDLINHRAGQTTDGIWVDARALLMAALRDNNRMVMSLISRGADARLCKSLLNKNIRRDVGEYLYRYGAALPICRFAVSAYLVTAILEQGLPSGADSKRTRRNKDILLDRFELFQFRLQQMRKEHQIEVKWSLNRVMDIAENIFSITDGKSWIHGFEIQKTWNRTYDMLTSSGGHQLGHHSQPKPMLIVHRYESPSTGCAWDIFPDCVPTEPWVARIMEVKLLNCQEAAWEETLNALPLLRSSVCWEYIDNPKFEGQIPETSLISSSPDVIIIGWMDILKTTASIWMDKIMGTAYPISIGLEEEINVPIVGTNHSEPSKDEANTINIITSGLSEEETDQKSETKESIVNLTDQTADGEDFDAAKQISAQEDDRKSHHCYLSKQLFKTKKT